MSSIIQKKAKRTAEARFEKYVNCETSGFKELVQAAWVDAKPAFEDHEDPAGNGVFDFYVSAKDHPDVTVDHVLDVLCVMDDFKDDMKHVQVYRKDEDDETKFEISLVYGNLRDEQFDTLVNEHRTKKRRVVELVDEEEEESAAEAAAAESPEQTLSGFPNDDNPTNAKFVALLKAGKLQLKLVERPGHAPEQAIEPGPKGRRSDVFDYRELFKQCTPRFFFNGEAKEWRRTAPEGWTGQPPAAA